MAQIATGLHVCCKVSLLHYHLLQGCYGEKVHKAVVAAGVRYSGATVHFVDEEFDSGAILAQRVVPVYPTDTYSQVGVLGVANILL